VFYLYVLDLPEYNIIIINRHDISEILLKVLTLYD